MITFNMHFYLAPLFVFAASTASFAKDVPIRVLFFGDSITAGFGVSASQAYPQLVESKFKTKGKNIEIINSGVSGDTTTSGLMRADWVLGNRQMDYVVVALGANDMLRGVPPKSTEKNLYELIKKIRKTGAKPILFGMKSLPNMGGEFKRAYDDLFQRVAKKEHVPYLDFFLKDVAGNPKLHQADGIHPNAAGQEIIAQNVTLFLQKVLP